MITEYWVETDVEGKSYDRIWATISAFPEEIEKNNEKLGKIASFKVCYLAVTFSLYNCIESLA
jgi:hypothetical protein